MCGRTSWFTQRCKRFSLNCCKDAIFILWGADVASGACNIRINDGSNGILDIPGVKILLKMLGVRMAYGEPCRSGCAGLVGCVWLCGVYAVYFLAGDYAIALSQH